MAKGEKPTHYIAVTAKVGKGKYHKGPYIGLWSGEADDGPLFRGSASGKYLDELYAFIKEYGDDTVSFAVFKSLDQEESRGRKRDRDDDREKDRDEDRSSKRHKRDNGDDEKPSRKRRDRDEEPSEKKSKWWED